MVVQDHQNIAYLGQTVGNVRQTSSDALVVQDHQNIAYLGQTVGNVRQTSSDALVVQDHQNIAYLGQTVGHCWFKRRNEDGKEDRMARQRGAGPKETDLSSDGIRVTAALDVSITSLLKPVILLEAGVLATAAAQATESRKHHANDPKFSDRGSSCDPQPLPASSLGLRTACLKKPNAIFSEAIMAIYYIRTPFTCQSTASIKNYVRAESARCARLHHSKANCSSSGARYRPKAGEGIAPNQALAWGY
ncbi:hypothetical protein EMCRGX_G008782 [Ephydatia muelleri]